MAVQVKRLFELFVTFFRIGLFTFGGGYAMIAIIEDTCVERKKWITHEDMMNLTVVAESTPGPIAVNAATFIGKQQAGIPGAAAATLGVILPSFIIIYVISVFFENFLEIRWVAKAFQGIKAAVGILILDAGIRMIKQMPKKLLPRLILIVTFSLMMLIDFFSWKISTITLLLVSAAVSFAASLIEGRKTGKDGEKP